MNEVSLLLDPALEVLGSSSTFGGLDLDVLREVLERTESVTVPAGEKLWDAGSASAEMYIVIHGRLLAARGFAADAPTVGEVVRGECIGEVSVAGEPDAMDPDRDVTIRASKTTELRRLTRDALDAISARFPMVREALAERARQRLTPTDSRQLRPPKAELVDLLAATDLCQGADREALERLADEIEWLHLPGGSMLTRQGEPSDSMYLLLKGRMAASVTLPGGMPRVVGYITQGQVVGEIGAISGVPRTANVRAVRDCEVARITWSAFERLVRVHPDLLIKTTRLIIHRLTESLKKGPRRSKQEIKTVTLVPTSEQVPVAELARQLEAALAKHGRTKTIDATTVDASLGADASATAPGAARSRKLVAWLDAREHEHDFVIYIAQTAASAWSRRCLRQADHIFVVGSVGEPTTIGPCEWLCLQREPSETCRRDLVLLHTSDVLARETRSWLLARNVSLHHHVRLGVAEDLRRLARFVTGRAVGLVLGGGEARCLAHVGVVRALRERGIPIDLVGGTNLGAVIAAQLACEWNQRAMFERNQIEWTGDDRTPDAVASRVEDQLRAMFGQTSMEDLWLNCFCLASSLTRAKEVVFDRGLLVDHLRASLATPGILPPVLREGDVLVDGAVLNSLPTDVMRERCPGYVIAVDVNPPTDMTLGVEGASAKEAQSFWSRMLAARPESSGPGMRELITRMSGLATVRRRREIEAACDLFIAPDVGRFGPYDWGSLGKFEAVGYLAATSALEGWRYAIPEDGART